MANKSNRPNNQRLDKEMAARGLTLSRSQSENLINLGHVQVNGQTVLKPAKIVARTDKIKIRHEVQYVSRAALKLKSASENFGLIFRDQTVLDVGSSTGGFTDYALRRGAAKVVAVDVGTNQLHPTLRGDARIELYEQTDIRDYVKTDTLHYDKILIDVSFISLRDILPALLAVADKQTEIIAMCKPQFEAGDNKKHDGVIKNKTMRREVLKSFEQWLAKNGFRISNKADSEVSGKKGNVERFYLLKI